MSSIDSIETDQNSASIDSNCLSNKFQLLNLDDQTENNHNSTIDGWKYSKIMLQFDFSASQLCLYVWRPDSERSSETWSRLRSLKPKWE